MEGPLGILILIGLAMAILPAITLIGLAAGICAAVYYALKNKYPQKALSWFFLKVDEPDGTVLPLGELKSRIKESFSRDTMEARETVNMETSTEKKKTSGWSTLEIILAVILACLVCLLAIFARGGLSQAQVSSEALPKHTVNDYQSNKIGTGFLYVIVADKSLTEEDAKKIISY